MAASKGPKEPAPLTYKPRRSPGGQFAPGSSGNPGGRPRVPADMKNLMALGSLASAKFLIELVGNEKADVNARLKAATLLLAHGKGAPAPGHGAASLELEPLSGSGAALVGFELDSLLPAQGNDLFSII